VFVWVHSLAANVCLWVLEVRVMRVFPQGPIVDRMLRIDIAAIFVVNPIDSMHIQIYGRDLKIVRHQ
jgi:hypothetical protein